MFDNDWPHGVRMQYLHNDTTPQKCSSLHSKSERDECPRMQNVRSAKPGTRAEASGARSIELGIYLPSRHYHFGYTFSSVCFHFYLS
jgi:hypothetical protein